MRAEKKCKWLRPLRRKSDGFGAGISAHDLELKEDHMATKPMNLNAGLEGLQTLVKTKGTILDRWLADKQEWAPIALRVPLGMIFLLMAHRKCSAGLAVTAGTERCSTSLNRFTFRLGLQRSRF